ncbi:MAG: T9SS type A sorting domain-containing protein [Candidatus Cloacimonetes bacterium]|nr:T9SS type A sorting domain-containing protein [Candidatus Cloacimonadota bacterium]
MKGIICFILLISLAGILGSMDIQQPNREAIDRKFICRTIEPAAARTAPVVTFELAPQIITPGTYYDYMLGSYNGCTLKMQPAISEPYLFPADGYYHSFMFQQTVSSDRRVYYTYIDASYNISTPNAISANSIREGYSTVAMDPVTANPFVTWHCDLDQVDPEWECVMSYDMYNVIGGSGLWKQPFAFFFAPTPGFEQYNEIWWPVVHVGPSPTAGLRRIHVYGNYVPASGLANYNCIYAYVDVDYDDANFDMSLSEWTYQSFPKFDYWQDNSLKRAIKDMAVSDDGQVAFIGHANDSLFIYHSVDYGETFELYMQNAHWDVFNPQNQDDSYVFENSDGSPAEVFIEPNGDGGHYNAMFTDNNSKILYMTAFGINTVETQSNQQYYPAHFHPKILYYDISAGIFDFVDLQFTGVDAYDEQPMIPYDLDEDGEVDSYDNNGFVEFANIWPSFWVGDYQYGAFHYSNFKCAKNEDKGWVIAIFQDGRYAWEAFWETPGYEDWAETSQIAICVSRDHGITWSEPAYLNAKTDDENYYPELADMIPCFVYCCDYIEEIDDTHGRVPVVFFDDNSYGSYNPNGHGQPTGGAQVFAVLNIEFPESSTSDNEISPAITLSQNYPNPFNPTTTIKYSLATGSRVELQVFNLKGQLVRTLVDQENPAGEYTVTWNGTDNNNLSVTSGVYLYRLKTESNIKIRKMILLR